VPITLLTRSSHVEPSTSPLATIGVWGTTSRPRVTVRRPRVAEPNSPKDFRQVQRLGNPLINELLIGTGFKDRFSMDEPKNDSQFASFFLDPTLSRIVNDATSGALALPNA